MVEDWVKMRLPKKKVFEAFYWLGYVAVVFLLIFLWSAEHVEGMSATDVD